MLVYVAGDCYVATDTVSLDADAVFCTAFAWCFIDGAPDVQAVAAGRYLDVVVWVVCDELRGSHVCAPLVKHMVQVNATDSVSENIAKSDTGA